MHLFVVQRWEFIKENKKVRKQENRLSTKKVIKKKKKKDGKHALDQESDQEKTTTAKKKERKHALDQECDQEKRKTFFFFS